MTALLPTQLFGQVINHFSHQDAKWNVAKTFIAATQEFPSFAATTTKVYGYQGDSTINGKTWSKMYSTNDSLFQNNLVFEGLTRVENDLILYKNTANPIDTLYNFDLAVGDSVFYELGVYPDWIYVEEIKTIQINGQDYRKFIFSEPNIIGFFQLNEQWIEGIGSIHGPLFPNTPGRFSGEIPDSLILTCSFVNNQEFYDHPSFSDCYVDITLGIENQEVINLNIYPNPVSSILTIESTQNLNNNIRIYDVNGKLLRTERANGDTMKIDVSSFEKGVYFLHFEVGMKKVVKKVLIGK